MSSAVHPGNELASRERKSVGQRAHDSSFGRLRTRIRGCKPFVVPHDFQRLVGRAVVDKDEFQSLRTPARECCSIAAAMYRSALYIRHHDRKSLESFASSRFVGNEHCRAAAIRQVALTDLACPEPRFAASKSRAMLPRNLSHGNGTCPGLIGGSGRTQGQARK